MWKIFRRAVLPRATLVFTDAFERDMVRPDPRSTWLVDR